MPITSLIGELEFTPDPVLSAGRYPPISAQRAADIYLPQVNLEGPPLYVAHGVARAVGKSPARPAWLIIGKVPPMRPMAVGPVCSNGVQCNWAVDDWAAGLVDDRTGHILRSVTTLREVPAPSPTPSASG